MSELVEIRRKTEAQLRALETLKADMPDGGETTLDEAIDECRHWHQQLATTCSA